MLGFLKIFGRLGAIVTLIMLIVTLLKQLVALVGALLFVIKMATIVAFAGLILVMVLAFLRGRERRRRDMEEL